MDSEDLPSWSEMPYRGLNNDVGLACIFKLRESHASLLAKHQRRECVRGVGESMTLVSLSLTEGR